MTNWAALAASHHAPLDDSTRYLAAATHLDSSYADDAIREYLVEPTRPVPPSPGFDAPTVLAEAISARSRRKYRDGLLGVLALVFLYFSFGTPLFYAWVVLAVLLSIRSIWLKMRTGRPGAVIRGFGRLLVLALFLSIPALIAFWSVIADELDLDSSPSYSSSRYSSGPYDSVDVVGLSNSSSTLIGSIAAVLMLLIVVADRITVWRLLTVRYGRRSRSRPFGGKPLDERPSIAAAPPRFRAELNRHRHDRHVASGDGVVPLVVYRGYNPFVGAGVARQPWSMVLPLDKLDETAKPDGSPFDELTTVAFYRRIREAMQVLQRSEALSPDRRLRELRINDVVYASADELIDHANEPVALPYLPRHDGPPSYLLAAGEAEQVRRQPREWARHYLTFQVETWDRDLMMSAFLHAAVDSSTLYLEWTPYVLPPIRDEYRVVDRMTLNYLKPIRQGVLRWLKLPVTTPGRVWHAMKTIRPLPYDQNTPNPSRYGSAETLRELAAAEEVRDYFQLVDVERYEKILESRLVPAISQVLRDCGYSPAQFERQAAMVVNNEITVTGTNNAPIMTGGVNQGTISGGTVQPPRNEEK
jgi:phosphatidylglycerophosphate synthase